MLYEPAMDTVCLLGWAPGLLILSFRGTASLANIRADLSVRTNFVLRCIEALLPTLLLATGSCMVHRGTTS